MSACIPESNLKPLTRACSESSIPVSPVYSSNQQQIPNPPLTNDGSRTEMGRLQGFINQDNLRRAILRRSATLQLRYLKCSQTLFGKFQQVSPLSSRLLHIRMAFRRCRISPCWILQGSALRMKSWKVHRGFGQETPKLSFTPQSLVEWNSFLCTDDIDGPRTSVISINASPPSPHTPVSSPL